MKNKKQDVELQIDKDDECLFSEPYNCRIYDDFDSPQLIKKVEGLNDHRLLAIVTALLVENRVDKINSFFLPKYKKLTDTSEFTFSMKIRLLEALNFIPIEITNASHLIRLIRNEFAHSFQKATFSDLENKNINKLKSLSHEVWKDVHGSTDIRNDLFRSFKKLSLFCLTYLDMYTSNVWLLREEISRKKFLESLKQKSFKMFEKSQTKWNEKLEKAMETPPIYTEIKDGKLFEFFEGGIYRIKSINE